MLCKVIRVFGVTTHGIWWWTHDMILPGGLSMPSWARLLCHKWSARGTFMGHGITMRCCIAKIGMKTCTVGCLMNIQVGYSLSILFVDSLDMLCPSECLAWLRSCGTTLHNTHHHFQSCVVCPILGRRIALIWTQPAWCHTAGVRIVPQSVLVVDALIHSACMSECTP